MHAQYINLLIHWVMGGFPGDSSGVAPSQPCSGMLGFALTCLCMSNAWLPASSSHWCCGRCQGISRSMGGTTSMIEACVRRWDSQPARSCARIPCTNDVTARMQSRRGWSYFCLWGFGTQVIMEDSRRHKGDTKLLDFTWVSQCWGPSYWPLVP